MKRELVCALVISFLSIGCASQWKIQGGPAECEKMCANWGLEFTAMVGVGNQEKTGDGATACVCQPKDKRRASLEGASGSSTGLAAPIVAAEQAATAANAAAAAQAAQLTQTRSQQNHHP